MNFTTTHLQSASLENLHVYSYTELKCDIDVMTILQWIIDKL